MLLVVAKNTTYVLKSFFPDGIIKKIENDACCVEIDKRLIPLLKQVLERTEIYTGTGDVKDEIY